MNDVPMATPSVEVIAKTFTGKLLRSTDAAFDEARRVHNGLIDKRPELIACCMGTAARKG